MGHLNERIDLPQVFVIDDHPIVSFGLLALVKDLAPGVRTRQFSNLKEAAQAAVRDFPALVITDFYLNDVRPESFVGLFDTLFPNIPVLISANDAPVMTQLKRQDSQRFSVFSKLTPFPKLMEHVRHALDQAGLYTAPVHSLPAKQLTHKQTQVLELIGAGLTNKDIAVTLNISLETVKGHVKDILERLNAKNRMEATVIYKHAQVHQVHDGVHHNA
ncbi:MAG TPA: response regulator transcription factor [Limnobacter sp.]|uniref:response regulator transcription factor n=1 Tax=Limnobacter sp. TaxID=2003368 RepID=UPI002EDB9489